MIIHHLFIAITRSVHANWHFETAPCCQMDKHYFENKFENARWDWISFTFLHIPSSYISFIFYFDITTNNLQCFFFRCLPFIHLFQSSFVLLNYYFFWKFHFTFQQKVCVSWAFDLLHLTLMIWLVLLGWKWYTKK